MKRIGKGHSGAAGSRLWLLVAGALIFGSLHLVGQESAPNSVPAVETMPLPTAASVDPAVQQLLAFRESDVKFNVTELMGLLRDRRHEGWVLAAYPDPKTGRPLIGAGFSLDLPQREHPQRDPLNPHTFIEPSSAQLWQAAGLDPARLQTILDQYHDNLAAWKMRRYRRRIGELAPQITDDEATRLLRVAVIQAIENAKAYCRNFDELTAPQQMAMSQLVYQMGVNLEEFGKFLNLVNDGSGEAGAESIAANDEQHWSAVQQSLIQSQWARAYRTRAASVIAMLDPQYAEDPGLSERRIALTLRPAVVHRRRGRYAASYRTASWSRHSGRGGVRRISHARRKRRI